jgi:hypothetical protein
VDRRSREDGGYRECKLAGEHFVTPGGPRRQ